MSISIGQRPMKREHMQIQALKGLTMALRNF